MAVKTMTGGGSVAIWDARWATRKWGTDSVVMESERTVNGMTPNETKNLSWKDAWWYLLNGKKIKRPLWDGYWAWENNTIMMHCRDGSVTDIRGTEFPAYTFSNIAQRDWMVV